MIFPNTDMLITSETLVMFPTASELFPPGCYTAVSPHIQTYFPWGLSSTHSFSYNVYFDDWEQSQSFKPKISQESFSTRIFSSTRASNGHANPESLKTVPSFLLQLGLY